MGFEDLAIGDTAVVQGYHPGDRIYRQRLLSMGLTPGTQFSVLRKAPLGDPVEIQLKGFHLSLRKEEAKILKIEKC